MSTAEEKERISLAEYFAYDESIEGRAEYYHGQIFEMAGGTFDHTVVTQNFIARMHAKLRASSCTVLGSDFRIEVEAGKNYCYPDASIVCASPQFSEFDKNALKNPTLLLEVSSPSTALYDRTVKFRRYAAIPSLYEYVIIQPDVVSVEVMLRRPDDKWLLTHYHSLTQLVILESMHIALPMAEIYDKVLFLNEDKA